MCPEKDIHYDWLYLSGFTVQLSLPLIGRNWTAELGPWEIATLRIPYDLAQTVEKTDLLERT